MASDFRHLKAGCIQGKSQPNTAKVAKTISGGAKYLLSFLKFKVKNRRNSAEEAKT